LPFESCARHGRNPVALEEREQKGQNHGAAKMSIRDRDSRIARPRHMTFLRRCRRARAIDGARPAWL
jgi:hypothetical protein